MTHVDDYWYDFPGFWGAPSRAHIRIVQAPDCPTVVVCSQPLDATGTSVQNAYEMIRAATLAHLPQRAWRRLQLMCADEAAALAGDVRCTGKLPAALGAWALDMLARGLREQWHRRLRWPQRPAVVWIEHWPPGCGARRGEDDYLLVRQEGDGSPCWAQVDIAALSEALGYEPRDLRKPVELFVV